MVKPTPSLTLSRELRRIGTCWPPDILRPRLQYGIFLGALSESQHISPRAVRASQILLENKLKEKYALGDRMMQPASYPDKYVRLVELLDNAADSKPSWWRRFWTDKE